MASQTTKIQTDRGLCKFYILGKCKRTDCEWIHTTNQCKTDDCGIYTDKKLCFKCNKKIRTEKKTAYEKNLQANGNPCSNETCKGLTLQGDYCNDCFDDAKQYILGPCRNKQCTNRVKGGRGFCNACTD